MDNATRKFVLQLTRLGKGMCTAAEQWVNDSDDIEHLTPDEFINRLKENFEVVDKRK